MFSHLTNRLDIRPIILKRRTLIPLGIWTLITVSLICYSYFDIKSWLDLIQDSGASAAQSVDESSTRPGDHPLSTIDAEAIFRRRFFFAVTLFLSVWGILCVATIIAVRQIHIRYELMQRSRKKHIRLEQLLRQSQKMEAVGQLAGGIAHDFNNLLGIILASAELAKGGCPEESGSSQYLADVLTAGESARQLIAQLKIFSGTKKLSIIRLDLNDLVAGFLKLLGRIIGGEINLVMARWPGELPVDVDKGQLEQVVMNLCLNARDAIEESEKEGGEIRLSCYRQRIEVADLEDKPWARCGDFHVLEVRDNGIGMDQKTAAKLFDPFFTTKPSGKGTGLGMSIIFTIVKSHEGFILFETVREKGTTFKIFLPEAKTLPGSPRLTEEETSTSEKQAKGRRRQKSILVAEDDDMLRKMICRQLSEAGYRIYQATTGARAVNLFRRHRDSIDLLLFDISMPEMSGIEACYEIRQLNSELPVLFTSGFSYQTVPEELMSSSRCDLLWKPYRRQELLDSIEKLL